MTKRRTLLNGIAAGIVAAGAIAGAAKAEVPVVDMVVGTNTAKTAAEMMQQVSLITDIKSTTMDTLKSIGSFGPRDIAPGGLWSGFQGGGPGAQALSAYKPDTCAIVACKGAGGGTEAPTGDYKATRDWVANTFYVNKTVSSVQSQNLIEIRSRARREAALSGYSLALTTRQELSGAPAKASSLEGIAKGANDMRDDIRANTAVSMAQYNQNVQMLALLTSLVEMTSAGHIAGDSLVSSVSSSSKVPIVRNEAEYNASGARVVAAETEQGTSTGLYIPGYGGIAPGAPSAASVLGSTIGWNPAVISASQRVPVMQGSPLGTLMGVGASLLSQTNPKLATAVNTLGYAVANGQSNPSGVVWAGAGALAGSSGNQSLYQVVSLGQMAANSGNQAQMNQLFIQTGTSVAGNALAQQQLTQVQNSWSSGQMSSQDAALKSTWIASQYGNYGSSGVAVANSLNQNVSGASQAQLNAYGMNVLNQVGQTAGDPTFRSFADTAYQNQAQFVK
jgi:hypothetical protein